MKPIPFRSARLCFNAPLGRKENQPQVNKPLGTFHDAGLSLWVDEHGDTYLVIDSTQAGAGLAIVLDPDGVDTTLHPALRQTRVRLSRAVDQRLIALVDLIAFLRKSAPRLLQLELFAPEAEKPA